MDQMALYFFVIGPGLVAILFVHELGHLLVARYFGIKVQTLSVGFGPQLMNFTDRFGTSWKLRAFPISGSCSVSDRLFPQVLWQRAAVYAAGPIFNLILAAAFCLIAPTFCKMSAPFSNEIGSPTANPSPERPHRK
jgi:regulator of sigma E protease